MKLKAFDRFLLALLLIVVIACTFVLFGISVGLIQQEVAESFLSLFYLNIGNRLILAACGLFLLIISLRLAFCGRGGTKEVRPAASLMRQSEIGGTYIAISAIESMIQKHCRQQAKVRDCSSTLRAVDNGVAISLKLSVLPDTDVVSLTDEMQRSLKEYIESLTGINVTEVSILVESTSASAQHPGAGRV